MIPACLRVLLCATPVDMRRSFDSLAKLVVEKLEDDPTIEGAMFVFVNAKRDKVKVLWRDTNGFCLLYKRWDDDVAALPEIPDGTTRVTMDAATLARLLDGAALKASTPAPPTTRDVVRAGRALAAAMLR